MGLHLGRLGGLLGASWGLFWASWGLLGVNPSASLPSAPQPSRLEGPLEPPFGRTLSQPWYAPESLRQYRFTRVNHHLYWRAIAFWNVCADARGLSVTLYWAGSCRTRKGKSTSSPPSTRGSTDLNVFTTPLRIYHTRKRLSSILTNPHW